MGGAIEPKKAGARAGERGPHPAQGPLTSVFGSFRKVQTHSSLATPPPTHTSGHPLASPSQLPASLLQHQTLTWKSPPCSDFNWEKNSEGSGIWHFRTFFSLNRGGGGRDGG